MNLTRTKIVIETFSGYKRSHAKRCVTCGAELSIPFFATGLSGKRRYYCMTCFERYLPAEYEEYKSQLMKRNRIKQK